MEHPLPEFSRPVTVDHLPAHETIMEIEAKPEERAALAERFEIPSIDSLKAEIHLKPIGGSSVLRVWGHFSAHVVQTCVLTLEPVPQQVEEDFEMSFAPEAGSRATSQELDFGAEDVPDPIVNGIVDIGEAVAEHLSLAMDPFPRAPGAELASSEGEDDAETRNPFAALEQLRKK